MLNKVRLLTPGPTPIPSRVRLIMAQEMLHHRKAAFKDVMLRIQPKLQQLFGTATPVLPLACSGTGSMTAAVHNLFTPKEKILVINGGKFGERWEQIATTYGCSVEVIKLAWGTAVAPHDVQKMLDADPSIRGVFMQLSETSTGVLHPVEQIAAITRERDVLLIVDGISAVGISPCPMDAWGIDCLLTGSQKGLMVPPGLALMALSERAWAKAATVPPTCFYFNVCKERSSIEKGQTLFTSPVSLLLALDESLSMILENGLEAVYRKQWALTCMAREGLHALGLLPFVQEHFTWGLTSVLLPEGIDATEVLQIAAERYGVLMAGGQDNFKGRMVRIGHMGWVDWADIAAGLYALAHAIEDRGGYFAARDYIEKALVAYENALASY